MVQISEGCPGTSAFPEIGAKLTLSEFRQKYPDHHPFDKEDPIFYPSELKTIKFIYQRTLMDFRKIVQVTLDDTRIIYIFPFVHPNDVVNKKLDKEANEKLDEIAEILAEERLQDYKERTKRKDITQAVRRIGMKTSKRLKDETDYDYKMRQGFAALDGASSRSLGTADWEDRAKRMNDASLLFSGKKGSSGDAAEDERFLKAVDMITRVPTCPPVFKVKDREKPTIVNSAIKKAMKYCTKLFKSAEFDYSVVPEKHKKAYGDLLERLRSILVEEGVNIVFLNNILNILEGVYECLICMQYYPYTYSLFADSVSIPDPKDYGNDEDFLYDIWEIVDKEDNSHKLRLLCSSIHNLLNTDSDKIGLVKQNKVFESVKFSLPTLMTKYSISEREQIINVLDTSDNCGIVDLNKIHEWTEAIVDKLKTRLVHGPAGQQTLLKSGGATQLKPKVVDEVLFCAVMKKLVVFVKLQMENGYNKNAKEAPNPQDWCHNITPALIRSVCEFSKKFRGPVALPLPETKYKPGKVDILDKKIDQKFKAMLPAKKKKPEVDPKRAEIEAQLRELDRQRRELERQLLKK
jgi:hypothetical protein